MAGDGYPKREKFFANRFVRLLTKAALAQQIGPEACWLLAVIAHQEDVIHYRRAVTYYNEQLMPLCGLGGRTRLVTVRQKAIAAGWLHYERGGKGTPGTYWVVVPDAYQDITDAACDESPNSVSRPESGRQSGRQTALSVPNQDTNRDNNRTTSGRQADDNPAPSYPKPKPKEESTSADSSTVVAADKSKPKAQDLLKLWNATPGVKAVRKMGPDRCKHFGARIDSDATWWDSVPTALQRVAASSFCRGGGGQGWVADIDWFLRPGTMNKILEGKYDEKPTGQTAPGPGQRHPEDVDGRW